MPHQSESFDNGRAILEFLTRMADSEDAEPLPDSLPTLSALEGRQMRRPALVLLSQVGADPNASDWHAPDVPYCHPGTGWMCIDLFSPSECWPDYSLLRIPLPSEVSVRELSYREQDGRFWLLLDDGMARTLSPVAVVAPFVSSLRQSRLSQATAQEAFLKLTRAAPAPLPMGDALQLWWDEKRQRYTAAMIAPAGPVQLVLDAGGAQEVAALASSFRAYLSDLPGHAADASRYAADSLLDIWNEHWADHEMEEQALTQDAFAAQLTLQSVSLGADGVFELSYLNASLDDVVVTFDPTRGYLEATLG